LLVKRTSVKLIGSTDQFLPLTVVAGLVLSARPVSD
jgi:hypothetical protein